MTGLPGFHFRSPANLGSVKISTKNNDSPWEGSCGILMEEAIWIRLEWNAQMFLILRKG